MLEAALDEMGQNLPVVLSSSRGWRARSPMKNSKGKLRAQPPFHRQTSLPFLPHKDVMQVPFRSIHPTPKAMHKMQVLQLPSVQTAAQTCMCVPAATGPSPVGQGYDFTSLHRATPRRARHHGELGKNAAIEIVLGFVRLYSQKCKVQPPGKRKA